MIYDHLNRTNKVFKLWALFFEYANNDHKFFIIDLVITLDWIMLLEKVSDWMKNFVLIVLKENVFKHIVQSINFYHNFMIWIIVTVRD